MSAVRTLGEALALALLIASPNASACGACIEDKVAATYDHAVIERARTRHQTVVFAAIDGKGDAVTLAREVKRAAARAPGVDVTSIRTAADPSALSFALDPRVATPDATLAAIARAASRNAVSLAVIRVVR